MVLKKITTAWKNYRDEKQLAAYEERDARLGTPTKETLNDRARQAAEKGHWKTALAAVDQGADVNAGYSWTQSYPNRGGGYHFEKKFALTFLAIEQDNAGALSKLLERGASRDFIGSWKVNDRFYTYSLPEYAAHNGAKNALQTILSTGSSKREALDGALRIAAGEPAYLAMTAALLAAGAEDYNGAQRAAELRRNDKAIILINKAFATAAVKKAAEPVPADAKPPGAARKNNPPTAAL